jgi:carbamoyl-phosphate synthase/aspartate carbamoyltransferase/dihydroorotase
MIELPGLIDPHVHLREPGQTHKEDFDSGTTAALAGGFTAVLTMPNTDPALTDASTLGQALAAASVNARCDYGVFLGAGEGNTASAAELALQTCGLKVYMDQTFGALRMQSLPALIEHFKKWPGSRPIACHAEGHSLAVVLALAHLFERRVHICHVSTGIEIQLIRLAKERGTQVTCEVTPHHLFLSEEDFPALGRGRSEVRSRLATPEDVADLPSGRSEVRPRLAVPEDVAALWESLEVIDCFATDHAPHTVAEKEGEEPPPGFPGLETALSLMLGAVREGRLTTDDLVLRMHTHPQRIYDLPPQQETHIEVDEDSVWEVSGAELHSRCGWSPFEGMKLRGRVRRVVLRGQLAYENGEAHAPPGFGRDLISTLVPA